MPLSQIFVASRRQDLAALCLVSKHVRPAANPWLYRSVVLDFCKCRDSLWSLSDTDVYRSLVQDLKVQELRSKDDHAGLRSLAEVIPLLANLQCFSWKAMEPIPNTLMEVLKANPSVRKIVVESFSLWHPGEPNYYFDLDLDPRSTTFVSNAFQLTQKDVRSLDTYADVDDFHFSSSHFPTRLEALHHVDSSRMRELHLSNCTEIGYLFNGLLCNIATVQLKDLTIRQEGLQANTGFFGKAKIECFLSIHKGLEEIEFTNVGGNMPCLQAILAQGSTPRSLKLVETKRKNNSGFEKAPYEYELEEQVNVRERCPNLRVFIINLESNQSKSNIAIDWDASVKREKAIA